MGGVLLVDGVPSVVAGQGAEPGPGTEPGQSSEAGQATEAEGAVEEREAVEVGRLVVVVRDAATGEELAARVSLGCADGSRPWGRDPEGKPFEHFGLPRYWASGELAVKVPAGETEVVVSRPYAWLPYQETVEVPAGGEVRVEARLERVVDLVAEGWYGGDAHDHVVHGEREYAVDIPLAARIAAAEGLDWSAFSGQWDSRRPASDQPDPEELDRLAEEASSATFLADWNLEHPKDHLGHMAAFPHGRRQTFEALSGANPYRATLEDRPRFTHAEILRGLEAAGTFAVYTHPTRELGGHEGSVGNIARELPFLAVAAPELLVGLDVMTDTPLHAPDERVWHLLLNRGLRLGLCAFTDTCYDRKRSRPGDTRTYVYLGQGPRTMERIKQAILTGRTFGSSGPLMLVRLDEHLPGEVLPADGRGRTLRIRAYNAMDYRDPRGEAFVARIEVIRNGEVWKTHEPSGQPHEVTVEYAVREQEGAWYVVRVQGEHRWQVAISSPFYFEGEDDTRPRGYAATVHGRVFDGAGRPIGKGTVQAVRRTVAGDEVVGMVEFTDGRFTLSCPATCRLVVAARGYAPQTKSIFLDCDEIFVDLFWKIRKANLIDPAFYERIERALDEVRLDFEMSELP